jgi:hypothetical protein
MPIWQCAVSQQGAVWCVQVRVPDGGTLNATQDVLHVHQPPSTRAEKPVASVQQVRQKAVVVQQVLMEYQEVCSWLDTFWSDIVVVLSVQAIA